ncbi:hypothetical protein C9374_009360 [Naegleria lovaniensis]|uniref:Uncharacterized protein n=1 Tax=Naegleria lovaniensis TaxID=51637 RepID=A0AA88GH80_NAELO|nr:uncharacterized protein C9374_009360 [Naegleria lovaniensis]KAG2377449.1 hypothetical protein C9374_009360 [Naegleria lovaniensis]
MQNPPPPHHDQGPRKPQYTLALVGPDRCGKTSLMRRLLFGSYEIPTNQVSEMNWEQFQTHLQDTNGLYIPILALRDYVPMKERQTLIPFIAFQLLRMIIGMNI